MYKLLVDEGEALEVGLVDVGDDQLVGGRQDGLASREELVKIFGSFAAHFWLEGRLNLAVFQLLPVDPPEEGMFSDVSLALRTAAQTLHWVFCHEPFTYGHGLLGHRFRI